MKHEPQILDECTPYLGEASDSFPLSVVLVYNDLHAALRAAQALERLGHKFHGKLRQCLHPIQFNYLQDAACFDHALHDASEADMVIVSFNGPGDLPAAVKKWVKDFTIQKREGDSALVALLSSNERVDAPDSPRFQFLRNAARAMGLDFFAPRPDPEEEIEMTSWMEVTG